MGEKKDSVSAAIDTLANSALSVANDLRGISRERFVRRQSENGAQALEDLFAAAGAEYLGITIEGKFNTSIITETINAQLEGSGLKFRDVLNKRMTKDDMRAFTNKKINEVMPKNLKFRSLARQDLNRGVKNFVKVRLKALALERAGELTLEDDADVLNMIAEYEDGRRYTNGNQDATGNSRQADFRANHSYFWRSK